MHLLEVCQFKRIHSLRVRQKRWYTTRPRNNSVAFFTYSQVSSVVRKRDDDDGDVVYDAILLLHPPRMRL